MEITTVASFIDYYEKIRARTNKVIAVVPPERLEWSYRQGKYTIGDIIRHIACIERFMYAEIVIGRKSAYRGCSVSMASGFEDVVTLFNALHVDSLTILRSLVDEDLQRKCTTPAGHSITIWKWLRALIEHEIHHRAQLYIYLGMIDVITPPIFGMTAEELESGADPVDKPK
jgi:uncharacterized damage-inducible protein DinB